MNFVLRIVFLLFLTATFAIAKQSEAPNEVLFSQEIVALDANGNAYPSVEIKPGGVDGLRDYRFDMAEHGALLIKSNIRDIEHRGLPDLVNAVESAYRFIHAETGRHPESGVLLYLIEMDEIPVAYSFQASYPKNAGWSEVRLALIEKGQPLFGPDAAQSVSELLFDTIPHELTHDVLAHLHSLPHDLNDQSSYHTRWFIEGVCELLAKRFAFDEAAYSRHRFLKHRHLERVLADSAVRNALFHWSQHNQNDMYMESDLYGAAMLVLMEWTRSVDLKALLDKIDNSPTPFQGADLERLLERTTGHDVEWIMDQGHQLGRKLLVEDKLAAYARE